MKSLKRMLVTLIAMAMMVAGFSALAFAAASPSVTSITTKMVSLSKSTFTYDGTAKTPTVTVTSSGKVLEKGTDYEVSIDKATAVGSYNVTITGLGLFKGTVTKTFKINQASLPTPSVSAVTYTGSKQTATIVVKDANGNTLKKGTDYTVTGTVSRTKVGTNSLTITGIGNYKGTKKVDFTVKAASIKNLDVADCKVVYNGKAQTASFTVQDANGNTLEEGEDYTVSKATQTEAGTYKVKITGKDNYTGSTTATFKIGSASISRAKITVKNVTYNGSKQTADVTVKGVDGKVLTAGKDYKVTNAKYTDAGTYQITITGKDNYTGTDTADFKIGRASVAKLNITVKSVTYNGKAQVPKITVKTAAGKTLKVGKDYTVASVSKTNAGTYEVKISGKDNYYSDTTVNFVIKKAEQAVKATVSGKTSFTVKASDLTKKDKSYTLKVSKAQGTVTYATSSKNITVKNGKITIARGTKAGTYRVRVKVAGTKNYEEADDQIITITVK